MAVRRHTISLLVENRFGVLARIAGLFSGRGYNIESLCVAETIDPTVSKMTIVTSGDDQVIEQINKQLRRLVDVIKIQDLTETDHVERELVLIKVNATPQNRAEIMRTVDIFRGKIIDVSPDAYVIEITGSEDKLNAFIELMKSFGIKDIARTGKVAMTRSSKTKT